MVTIAEGLGMPFDSAKDAVKTTRKKKLLDWSYKEENNTEFEPFSCAFAEGLECYFRVGLCNLE